ncbi:MAG: hypothetical protein HY819_11890 [Acidobacteria bacterium]|nr:hypothetical protein [Acidobacteriota bacterium]
MINNVSNNSINNTQNTQSVQNAQQNNKFGDDSNKTGVLVGGGRELTVKKGELNTTDSPRKLTPGVPKEFVKPAVGQYGQNCQPSPINCQPTPTNGYGKEPNPASGYGKANTYNSDDCKPQVMKYSKMNSTENTNMDKMQGMDSTEKTGKTNKKDEQIKDLTKTLESALKAIGSLADSNKELVGLLKEALSALKNGGSNPPATGNPGNTDKTPPAGGSDPTKGADPSKGTDPTKGTDPAKGAENKELAGLLGQIVDLLKKLLESLKGGQDKDAKQGGPGNAGQTGQTGQTGQAGGAGQTGQTGQVDPSKGAEEGSEIGQLLEQLKSLIGQLEAALKNAGGGNANQQQAQDTLMAKMSTMKV